MQNKSEALRILPSDPDYQRINYIQTMIAMLVNPQVHFNTARFLAETKNFPSAERAVADFDRSQMISELKAELTLLFAKHTPNLDIFASYLKTLKWGDDDFSTFIDGLDTL